MAIPTPTTPIYDPELPVYAEPDLESQDVDIEQKSDEDYINPAEATVEGRTNRLLQSNSPLMQRAEAQAMQRANQRGLLNSSMAIEAGQAAVMDKALQITQPDAATYAQFAQNRQQTDQSAALNNQIAAHELNREKARGRIQSALTTQEQGGQVELQRIQDNAQMRRVEIDNQWKKEINIDNLDAADRQALMDVSRVFGESLTGGIERIMRDTNVENKTEAIESLFTQYRTQMTTAAAIVNLNLSWD
jgi:hypothetical protein